MARDGDMMLYYLFITQITYLSGCSVSVFFFYSWGSVQHRDCTNFQTIIEIAPLGLDNLIQWQCSQVVVYLQTRWWDSCRRNRVWRTYSDSCSQRLVGTYVTWTLQNVSSTCVRHFDTWVRVVWDLCPTFQSNVYLILNLFQNNAKKK